MLKILSFKDKHNIIISMISSLIIIVTFYLQDYTKSYGIFQIILFGIIYYMFYKTSFEAKDRKHIIVNIILSGIFSTVMVLGWNCKRYYLSMDINIIKQVLSIKSLICFLGYFILFLTLLSNILEIINNINIKNTKNIEKYRGLRVYVIALLIILISWLPFFIVEYPGGLSPDSIAEINAIIDCNINSDHHPILHQIFLCFFYNIGYSIFSSQNAAIAFITLIQMLIMANIFAYATVFLYKRNVSKKVLLIINLFYALYPAFGLYSIIMWKDVLFSGFILLLLLNLVKLIELGDYIKWNDLISLFIISLLVIFFRNNAVYMYILFVPFAILFFRKNRLKFTLLFVMVIAIFFIVKIPIFNYLNISRSRTSEYLAVPLQQIARMVYKNVEFTEEEYTTINELIPVEVIKEVYNPTTVDPIKFNENYNRYLLTDKNKKKEFIKTYLDLVIKHFDISVESYLISTLGYWYYDVESTTRSCNYIEDNDLNIYQTSKVNGPLRKYVTGIQSLKIPFLSMQWSIALYFSIILIYMVVCLMRNGTKSILLYIPIWGIWLTLMIAAPVWAEFRYIFSACTCLPVLLCYPYIYRNNSR